MAVPGDAADAQNDAGVLYLPIGQLAPSRRRDT